MDAHERLREALKQLVQMAPLEMDDLARVASFVLEQVNAKKVQETKRLPMMTPETSAPPKSMEDISIVMGPEPHIPKSPLRSLTAKDTKRIRRLFKGIAAHTHEYREIRDKISTELGITPRQIGGALNKNRH